MRKIFIILSFVLTLPVLTFAHGGGTDSCGGHRDRKRGGYHTHNYAKYCACYPNEASCKKEPEQTKESAKSNKQEGKENQH